MTEPSPVEVVRAFFDGMESGDLQAVSRHAAADVVYVIHGQDEATASAIPWAGRHRGRIALTTALSTMQMELVIGEFAIGSMISEGGLVATAGRYRATSRSTGRCFETPFVHFATVIDGFISHCTMAEDSAAVSTAIGASDAPIGRSRF